MTDNLPNIKSRIDGVDSEIHQENLSKIKNMSKQEIMDELQALKDTLNPKLLSKLKNLGKNEDAKP